MTQALYYPYGVPYYSNYAYQQYANYSPLYYDNFMNTGWYNQATWPSYSSYMTPYYYPEKIPYFNGNYGSMPYMDQSLYLYNYYWPAASYNYYWPLQNYYWQYNKPAYQPPLLEYPHQTTNNTTATTSYQNDWFELTSSSLCAEVTGNSKNLALPKALTPGRGVNLFESVDRGATTLGSDETEYVIRVENYESLNHSLRVGLSPKYSEHSVVAEVTTSRKTSWCENIGLTAIDSEGDFYKLSRRPKSVLS